MSIDMKRRALLQAAAAASLFPSIAQAQAQEITLSWYPGLTGANLKKSFWETFKDKNLVKIVESFDNPRFTQMQANRDKPTLHVAIFIDVLLPLIARSGMLQEMTPALIPNLKDVDPRITLPIGNLAVPVQYGAWGIAWNSKHIKRPITSWADLMRDDLKRHVSAPNITFNSSIYTLEALAALKNGTLRNPDVGMEFMHQIRKSGPGLWDQESIAIGWLKTGEIWATPYFSGNVLAMMKDPDLSDLRFAVPTEGAFAVPLNVTRVKNSTGGNTPEAFINHMLSLPAQEEWARVGGGRPVNVKAAVPKEVAETVPTIDKLRRVDWEYFAENRTAIVDKWNKIVNR